MAQPTKFKAQNYSVTGSFTPTAFRFYQTKRDEMADIFEKAVESALGLTRHLSPVVVTSEGYLGTNYAYVPDGKAVSEDKDMRLSPNPGRRQTARLTQDNDTLVVAGSIKFVESYRQPIICDDDIYKEHHKLFVDTYLKDTSRLEQLMTRYLKNIADGRILWRNQWGFSRRAVFTLRTPDGLAENFYVTGSSSPRFKELVTQVADIVKQPKSYFYLDVALSIELAPDEEVFPSQLFPEEKDKEYERGRSWSRMLASRADAQGRNQAILSAQKVGNALRTIDVWYEDPTEADDPRTSDKQDEPIAVEAYGAVVRQRKAHRTDNKNSYYDLMPRNYDELHQSQRDYIMAILLKGGLLAYPEKKAEKK